MLSILIPSYNYNITSLVKSIHAQALEAKITFEIWVIEDGSTHCLEENQEISKLSFCHYEILSNNIGRSAIRNLLADKSSYDYLLFLDCDAAIHQDKFIETYLHYCKSEIVVLGGRVYDNNIDSQYSLISKYGKKREQNNFKNLLNREKYKVFTSPNFLISKSIFNQVRFDEKITTYGHEDTIFGLKLEDIGIDYHFIDNPVVHVGLEDNKTFLMKTENSLQNLYHLYNSDLFSQLKFKSKVLATFLIIEKYHLKQFVKAIFSLTSPLLKMNLFSKYPSLLIFDFYKLGYICSIASN